MQFYTKKMIIFKKIIIKVLGRKRIEFIRSKPFWVHGKYRSIIDDIKKYENIIENNKWNDPELSLLLVRKYAHILDKGLHRDDVEPGHSKSVAIELEKHLMLIEKQEKYNADETVTWAKQKLEIYKQLQTTGKIIPLAGTKAKNTINYDQFVNLLQTRRSNRQFINKPIAEDTLFKLAETVNWASSSCNKQPIILFATNNPDLAKACLKQCKGGTGFSEFIPCFIAFCADMRGYYLPDEMYLPAIDVSLGAQNLFIATELLNLSCCGLTWAQKDEFEETELRRLLNIPYTHQIIFNAVIGHPSVQYVTPIRKSAIETLTITK